MRKLNNNMVFFAVLSFCLWGCAEDESSDSNDLTNKVVVEAYVYANEKIDHVKISRIHSEGLATSLPVIDAEVQVSQGGNIFFLYPSDTIPGWYHQAETDSIFPNGNDNMNLLIHSQGNNYTSTCYMPSQITGLTISNTAIQVIPGDDQQTVATLSWDVMPGVSSYAIIVRQVPSNADYVELYTPDQNNNPFLDIVHSNVVELKSAHFRYYGSYQLYVTAVSQEYEMFYDQPSSGMANATGNISNGWGIFTAFHGTSINVTVQ